MTTEPHAYCVDCYGTGWKHVSPASGRPPWETVACHCLDLPAEQVNQFPLLDRVQDALEALYSGADWTDADALIDQLAGRGVRLALD